MQVRCHQRRLDIRCAVTHNMADPMTERREQHTRQRDTYQERHAQRHQPCRPQLTDHPPPPRSGWWPGQRVRLRILLVHQPPCLAGTLDRQRDTQTPLRATLTVRFPSYPPGFLLHFL